MNYFSSYKFYSVFLSVILIVFITACKKDTSDQTIVILNASPDTLIISDDAVSVEILLSTSPNLKTEFEISQAPDWLSISPIKGTINDNIVHVTATPNKINLEQGIYTGKVSIISDKAGISEVTVIMSVSGHPKIEVTPAEINFPANTDEAMLEIQNIGTGIIEWSIKNESAWIELSRTSGYLMKDEKQSVVVKCNRRGLNMNSYTSTLEIISNSETAQAPIHVAMEVPAFTEMKVSSKNLLFDYFQESREVYLINSGNTSITWSSTCQNFFTLFPASGTLGQGDSVKVNILLKRNTLESGTIYSNIYLTNHTGEKDTISAQINNYVDNKWILNFNLIDAEYCKVTDKLIAVAANPNRLLIIDPLTKQTSSINLNFLPTCVSVMNDGQSAVVGHDGNISYVNLNSNTVIRTYSVSTNALDIVIAPNKWAYVFPKTDQWAFIHCVNLNLTYDNEVNHSGYSIYAGTKARLHPSGDYIYGADNGLSPSDIEKYDIRDGQAVYMYDSPYHGDYPMSGNLWYSEDGNRLFTKGQTVLKLSEIQELDMRYNGTIELESNYANIVWLDHSAPLDRLFLISSGDDYWTGVNNPFIYEYNALNLAFIKKFELEKFMVPNGTGGGTLYNAEPYFIFSNASGTKLFAITKATGAGLSNEWSIEVISIN